MYTGIPVKIRGTETKQPVNKWRRSDPAVALRSVNERITIRVTFSSGIPVNDEHHHVFPIPIVYSVIRLG